jgi:hypothetical protein
MWDAVGSASGPAIPIGYHLWWPAGNDPFYHYAPLVSRARAAADCYAIGGAPHMRVDGEVVGDPGSSAQILTMIEAKLVKERALRMSIERIQDADQVTVNVSGSVDLDPGPADGWRLYIVLYETQVEIPPNQAPNGQLVYKDAVRHMSGEATLPDGALGEPIALTPGADFQASATFAPDFEVVNPANVRALAFVQHDETLAILDLAIEPNGGP